MRLISSVRSVFAAFKASAALGRVTRKQREGNLAEDLAVALEGLSESRVPVDEALKKSSKKTGWFSGYGTHYSQRFAIDFEICPENLRLLEEVAR